MNAENFSKGFSAEVESDRIRRSTTRVRRHVRRLIEFAVHRNLKRFRTQQYTVNDATELLQQSASGANSQISWGAKFFMA